MQSNAIRAGVGVALVAVAVVLFIVLSGSDDDDDGAGGGTPQAATRTNGAPAPAPSVQTIRLRDGAPVGGVQEVEVAGGEPAQFRVLSDIAGDVHVHGYDIEMPIEAGGSVRFDFPAELEGGFEIELHHGGGETQIGELRVQP
jgi:hypothetical protein